MDKYNFWLLKDSKGYATPSLHLLFSMPLTASARDALDAVPYDSALDYDPSTPSQLTHFSHDADPPPWHPCSVSTCIYLSHRYARQKIASTLHTVLSQRSAQDRQQQLKLFYSTSHINNDR